MKLKQVVLGALAGLLLAGFAAQSAAPVFAGGTTGGAKCNSGKGNGFETDPSNDCDPGNSGSHNNGGG